MPVSAAQPRGRTVAPAAAFSLICAALLSCSSDGGSGPPPPNNTPAAVNATAGTGQSAVAGTAVATPPAVTVTNSAGQGVSGVSVTFAVASGGGSVTGGSATTNAQGVATVGSWTLGTTAGPNSLTATVANLTPVTFNATGTAGAAADLTIAAGDGQTANSGEAVAVAPSVIVTDANLNPVAGVQVTFTPILGNGSVTGSPATSNASGIATVGSWIMGDIGANHLSATAPGVASGETFVATSQQGPPSIVTTTAGDNQSVLVGTAVPADIEVTVTDLGGNPSAGETVNFVVATGGGSVSNASQVTDGAGVAVLPGGSWTLGTGSGAQTLSADVAGGPSGTVTADATPDAAASLQIEAGDGQTAVVGTAVPIPPAVRVLDQYSNPVPGESVDFVVTGGGGSVTGSPATSDAQGIATVGSWTMGGTPGANSLEAQSGALTPVSFGATGSVNVGGISTNAGDNQNATVNTTVAGDIEVLVTTTGMTPAPGVQVTFTVASGGGSVSNAVQMTDASGIATLPGGNWTLGTTAGANTLDATPNGFAFTTTINATGDADAPASIILVEGDNQTGTFVSPVATDPKVRLEDQFGNPVPNVQVTFTPGAGSGMASPMMINSDAAGEASTSWTLGQSGHNDLTVTEGGGGAGSVTFFGIGSANGYQIELGYLSSATDNQRIAFANAAGRWMDIITGDLGSVSMPANFCGVGEPAFNVDDLVIWISLGPIDGPGGILGAAGPCAGRNPAGPTPFLSINGVMIFDTADLASLEGSGLLEDVILHEMGHVIGIGTWWGDSENAYAGLLQNPSCGGPVSGPCNPDLNGANTHINGAQSIASFDNVGGNVWDPSPDTANSKVPVENTQGDRGTRDSHWRESTFVTELMTGFIAAGSNPLSEVTIAVLQDLGYTVDLGQADAYTLGNPNALRLGPSADALELKNDIFVPPAGRSTPPGVVRFQR